MVVRSRLGGCPHREEEEGQQDTGSFENPFDRESHARVGRPGVRLTGLADTQDFAKDERQLDAAAGERALVLVFPAAVLQDKLGKRLNTHFNFNTVDAKILIFSQKSHRDKETSNYFKHYYYNYYCH